MIGIAGGVDEMPLWRLAAHPGMKQRIIADPREVVRRALEDVAGTVQFAYCWPTEGPLQDMMMKNGARRATESLKRAISPNSAKMKS